MTAPSSEIPAAVADSLDQIREFCLRWHLLRLSLFGSVLRDDFRPESDIDVLIERSEQTPRGFRERDAMRDELAELLGRPVDLVYRSGLVNPYRRWEILRTARTIYAA